MNKYVVVCIFFNGTSVVDVLGQIASTADLLDLCIVSANPVDVLVNPFNLSRVCTDRHMPKNKNWSIKGLTPFLHENNGDRFVDFVGEVKPSSITNLKRP